MKAWVALVCLSLAVMVGLIFQTVAQELKLHKVRANILGEEELVKKKMAEVTEMKLRMKGLNDQLENAKAQVNEQKEKKLRTEKSLMDFEGKLQNCNKDKDDSMMKKATIEANITKLKAEQEKAKSRADADIVKLKENIFQRDRAICRFVDMTTIEARKLCGLDKESA